MIFLLLAIFGSASLPVLFRAFDDWRVNVLWAIPINYFTCVAIGSLFVGRQFDLATIHAQPWMPIAVLQGIILAGNFFLIAYTAQRAGVSIAALASRLSVVIPSLLAVALYGDSLTLLKIIGLGAALLSLYLFTAPDGKPRATTFFAHRFLPVVVFFSFGCYFSVVKYAQITYLDAFSYHAYVMSSFVFAFFTSVVFVTIRGVLGAVEFRVRHLGGGLLLGTINYIAVFALINVLGLEGWESSQVFPIYSVGVVVVSTILAMLFFGERLSRQKTVGLIVGIAAVAILNQ